MSERIRLTRSFLLEQRERLEVMQEGKELLEMKRDELSTKLRDLLDKLEAARKFFVDRVEKVLEHFIVIYSNVGPDLMHAYAGSLREAIEVEVLPTTIMGVNVPFIKLQNLPDVKDKYPPPLRKAADDFHSLLKDLLKVTELEIKITRIADELRRTNRTVNSLEEIVIPQMEETIKKIEERLEEEVVEEFIRVKQAKEITRREG